MLPETSGYQSRLVQNFVARKTNSVAETWEKGLAFGYKDCQLWFGVKLVRSPIPTGETRKHPRYDYYVNTVQATTKLMNMEKRKLEATFKSDFKDMRRTDNLTSSAIINRMLEYDQFMHLALQDFLLIKRFLNLFSNVFPT